MAQLNFNARDVAPSQGFETLPVDWYKLMAEESEIKPTKSAIAGQSNDCYLNVRFTVLEGLNTGTKLAGRKTFKSFNIRNGSAQAQRIALEQLSALAHAVGVMDVADSVMLHNIPFWARVKVRKAEEGSQYEDQNDITTFKHINDPPAAVVAAGPGAAGAPGGFTPPPATGGFQQSQLQQPNQWSPPAGNPPPNASPQGQWSPPAGQATPAHGSAPATYGQQPPGGYQMPNQPVQQPWNAGAPNTALPASAGMPTGPMGGQGGAPNSNPQASNPGPAPGQWTPPAGGQPWSHQPPQQSAQQPPTPPQNQQPPHPAQNSAPPWHRPAQ